MKKRMLLTLLASVALASCGGGSSEPGSASAPESSGGEKTKVDLTVWAGETDESFNYLKDVSEAFKKANTDFDYNFTIKAVSESSVNGDWAADAAQAADFAIAADDQIPSMIKSNLIASLETLDRAIPDLSTTIRNRNSDESVQMVTDQDKTWGFPVSASNGYILYYNSDYISEADTTSFESLLAAIKRASEKDGKTYRFGFPYNSGWYLDGWFHGAGFSATGLAGEATVACDWDKTVNGVDGKDVAGSLVKLAHGQYEQYWTSQEQSMIMTQIDTSSSSPIIATINGTWNYSRIKGTWGEKAKATTLPSFHVDLANKDFGMQSVKGFKIGIVNAKRTKTVRHSAKFAEFLTNYDNQVLRFNRLSEAPTNKQAAQDIDVNSNPAVKALNEQWNQGSFIEKVNEAFWNPSNSLSTLLCNGGNKGEYNYIKSGRGTADIQLDYDAIQTQLENTVKLLSGQQN